MAVTADRVVVELEARLDRYNRRIADADQRFNRSMGRITGTATRAERQTAAAFAGIGAAARNMAVAVVGALGVREVQRYADAWTQAGNKIAAATQISGIQGAGLSELADGAIEARSAFEPYVDLYARIQRAGANLSITQREVATATEVVSKAFVAGGATAQEQASGILQLGQALASGELLGEELRAIRENAPLVAQAIADEFDTTIGGLKELGAEGKLTAERVLTGILSAQASVEAAFRTTNATIGDSFQNVRTALIRYVGDADDAVGASEALASALNALADNLDLVAQGMLLLGSRAIAPLVAALAGRLVVAARAGAAAIATLGTSAGAAAGAMTVLRGALALLGGPIGAILVGLTGAGIAFSRMDTGARSAEDGINRLQGAIAKAEGSLSELQSVEQSLETDTDALKEANDRLNDAVATGGDVAEATAQADVAAISRRIQANEELRDAILNTIRAQEQSLRAEALVAERAFRREFAGPALTRVQTGAPGEGGPLGIAQGRATTAEEQIERQEAALQSLQQSAEEALAAGDVSEFQQKFLEARAELLSTKTAADELAASIDKVLAGGSAGDGETGTRTPPASGATGKGGGADPDKLNALEQAVASLREQNLAAAAEIRELNALNPLIDDYAISLGAAAIEQDLLTKAKEAGIEADRQQIRNLAEGTAALEEQRRAAADFGSAVDGIRAETRAIERETEALRGINPVLDEYGRATETALAEQELMNLAIQAGIPLTDELRDAIRQLAEGYGAASAEARKLAEDQRNFERGAKEFKEFSRNTFEGFIQGALEGKKATDILADALDRLGQKLMDLSLDAIFDTGGGSSGLSGFLSAASSILGLFGGGGQTLSAAPHLGIPGTFDSGGPTGGQRNRVAGVVHGEEFVVKAGPAQKFRPLLEAINEEKLRGFQHGDFVGSAPNMNIPDVGRRTGQQSSGGEQNINLGGLHVHGVQDVDGFRRSEPQMMADLQRKLSNVARRGTA